MATEQTEEPRVARYETTQLVRLLIALAHETIDAVADGDVSCVPTSLGMVQEYVDELKRRFPR